MKNLRYVYLLSILVVIFGCYQQVEGRGIVSGYPPINGKVVDAVTGHPLEGALVVAQWTKTHGLPGMRYHDHYKSIETHTNKDGTFKLSGTNDPFVEPPQMIIYKKGYVPWRNDLIFPSTNLVKKNEWNNDVTYKLEVFSDEYSYSHLYNFINSFIIDLGSKPEFHTIHNEISDKAVDESRAQKAKQ
jgi:hypothetical protein